MPDVVFLEVKGERLDVSHIIIVLCSFLFFSTCRDA